MNAFPLHRYTFEDYLRLEAESSTRHEFLDGEIVAVAGGTPAHAALAMAVGTQLNNQLARGNCRVYSSDLRVHVSESGLTTYPDVTVVCGPTERLRTSDTTVVNPKLVVEITSDSSEHYDRGPKLERYQTIPSLVSIVVVSHREPLVEVWIRQGAAWAKTESRRGERAMIAPLAVELDVDALYAAAAEPEA